MKFPFSNFQFPIRTPKVRMAIVLLALSTLAIFNSFSLDIVLRLVVIVSGTLALEFILWKIRAVTPFLPSAGLVTALIIFLLADPETPVHLVLLAVAASVGLKQFLRPENNHIFNPAAIGLLVAGIFGLPITWWGVGWGNVPFLVIIIGSGFVSLFTIRQHRIVLSFLATSLVVSTFYLGSFEQSVNQLLVGSFWFFALVMLPEPMTAAKFPLSRLAYGTLVAILPFFLANFTLAIADPLLASLLIGNATARLIEKWNQT